MAEGDKTTPPAQAEEPRYDAEYWAENVALIGTPSFEPKSYEVIGALDGESRKTFTQDQAKDLVRKWVDKYPVEADPATPDPEE